MLMTPYTTLRRVVVSVVLALALGLGIAAPAKAADPYTIYVVLPLTGFAAFIGQEISKTLGIIEEMTNARGGINGQPVKFSIADDQSNPAVAVQLTNGILARKVPVMLGSTISAMCQAQTPLVKDGPVLWCFSPVIRPPAGSYVFTTLQATEDYIEACLRYAQGRGWRKIAAIATTDTSGQDFEASLDRVLAKPEFRGITIAVRDRFNVSDISAAAQVARVKNSGAEAMLAWPTGTAIGTFFRGLQDAGVDIPTFTTPANGIYSLMRSLGQIIPSFLVFPGTGSYAPNLLSAGPVKTAVFQYIDSLRARGMVPDQSTVASWDPPVIMIQALRKYGTKATAEQIREFIANYRGPGIAGMYDFKAHPQRGLDASTVLLVRWDKTRQDWGGVSKFGGEPLSGN
jgi:branched-chain amino acid transport system substrate-binding protein